MQPPAAILGATLPESLQRPEAETCIRGFLRKHAAHRVVPLFAEELGH